MARYLGIIGSPRPVDDLVFRPPPAYQRGVLLFCDLSSEDLFVIEKTH
ncbi:MAG: hypothetical protein HYX22_00950 [Candidatus Yanofskybacteria bacterium]|nr:hypothetical protein [Candidatus Yanofskybacteria bacterium]